MGLILSFSLSVCLLARLSRPLLVVSAPGLLWASSQMAVLRPSICKYDRKAFKKGLFQVNKVEAVVCVHHLTSEAMQVTACQDLRGARIRLSA